MEWKQCPSLVTSLPLSASDFTQYKINLNELDEYWGVESKTGLSSI